jgi:hypothetical protein
MVGGHEKKNYSNTTSTSSSVSASAVSADWDIAPPLQNARVDTQYVGIIEEQKQQICWGNVDNVAGITKLGEQVAGNTKLE